MLRKHGPKRKTDRPSVGAAGIILRGVLSELSGRLSEATFFQRVAVRPEAQPEFDLENAHYGLFQGIGEVDFA